MHIEYIQKIVDDIPPDAPSEWRFIEPMDISAGYYPYIEDRVKESTRTHSLHEVWMARPSGGYTTDSGYIERCWMFGTTIFRPKNPVRTTIAEQRRDRYIAELDAMIRAEVPDPNQEWPPHP